MQRRASQQNCLLSPMPVVGGMISPTRESFCCHDDHSILPMSNRCWPPALAPSWSPKTTFMPRHAEHLNDVCRSVSSSCGSMLCRLQYSSTVTPEQGTVTVDTIYPATEKHISKHSAQNFIMVSESLPLHVRGQSCAQQLLTNVLSDGTADKCAE